LEGTGTDEVVILKCFVVLCVVLCAFRLLPWCDIFWNVTQLILVVRYWHFRTTYWSHLQGSCSPVILLGLLDAWSWDQ